MIKKQITIAIDGYSACGKSTLAKDLAKKLSFIYIDSGAMYRGVALYCLQNNLFDDDSNPKQVEIIQALKNITLSFQLINDNNCLLLNGKNIVLYAWYDNEFGYTKQVIRLAKYITKVRRAIYY